MLAVAADYCVGGYQGAHELFLSRGVRRSTTFSFRLAGEFPLSGPSWSFIFGVPFSTQKVVGLNDQDSVRHVCYSLECSSSVLDGTNLLTFKQFN